MKSLLSFLVALGTATSIVSFVLAFRQAGVSDHDRRRYRQLIVWSAAAALLSFTIVKLENATGTQNGKQPHKAAPPSGATGLAPSAPFSTPQPNTSAVPSSADTTTLGIMPCSLETQFASTSTPSRRKILLSGGNVNSMLQVYRNDLHIRSLEPEQVRIFFYREPKKLEWVDLNVPQSVWRASTLWTSPIWIIQKRGLAEANWKNAYKDVEALSISDPSGAAAILKADVLCGQS